MRCLQAAAGNGELVANYDRLRGTNLSRRGAPIELEIDRASGRLDADIKGFIDFVHEAIYTRLEPQALAQLRNHERSE
ncbi:hypothetical protein [Methylibium petroleiphilum]|uniref:hypothetical protein n=1 Tax=Methylibium petroleiphilum TaxID=105560 RepID=UPI00041F2279|nr:hypothetical protein [Methylibium petroleiphilum]